jgi:hypothetical protein
MKMFKCLGSMYPGNMRRIVLTLLAVLSYHSTLLAQSESINIPFTEGTSYRLNHAWSEEEMFISSDKVQPTYEKKSPSKAFFYSLILPGTGEAYAGEDLQNKIFLGFEIIGWSLVVANIINVDLRESDYKNYAVQHSQVNRKGKNDQYWIDIGKYNTIYEFNDQRRRERDVSVIYEEIPFYAWIWDRKDNRLLYDSWRIETREIEQNRLYFFAAIALNHLVSAVNALRLANAYNRRIEELSLKFNFDYNPRIGQVSLSLQKYF